MFTVTVLTGGTIGYKAHSDDGGSESYQTYRISGISQQFTSYEIEFDFQEPSHCFEIQESCTKDALTTNGDFLTQVKTLFILTLQSVYCFHIFDNLKTFLLLT